MQTHSETIYAREDVNVAWLVSLYRIDTNADQTITCAQERQGQGEHYVDVSSSDDEQVESLVCAAKKEGLYIDVVKFITIFE